MDRFALRHWLTLAGAPHRLIRHLARMPRYLADRRAYRRLPGAEALRWADSLPCLDDATGAHAVDHQYFYVNGWAARLIHEQRPDRHVDVSSQLVFAGIVSAFVPVAFVDYRPLAAALPGLTSVKGDILSLPFATGELKSLSCLHVVEHIGLGRYGEPLNPNGSVEACRELQRVLAAGGNLFLAAPAGRPRVCFNAHRVLDPRAVCEWLDQCELRQLAGVNDADEFLPETDVRTLSACEYGLGMFWFRKRPSVG
jgi:hypothetical protein